MLAGLRRRVEADRSARAVQLTQKLDELLAKVGGVVKVLDTWAYAIVYADGKKELEERVKLVRRRLAARIRLCIPPWRASARSPPS